MTIVFLTCICAMAWCDIRRGEVDWRLLYGSPVVTAVIAEEKFYVAAVVVFLAMTVLCLLGKTGWADVIVFTQIALLYGFIVFAEVFLTAPFLWLIWILGYLIFGATKRVETGDKVRYIPFIASAAMMVLACEKLLNISLISIFIFA